MNILIISNGFGEDLLATRLVTAIKKQDSKIQIQVLPLVGEGKEYAQIGLTPLIKNPSFPSGGFLRNIKSLVTDFQNGLITQHIQHYKLLKKLSPLPSVVICVGDIFCLLMGSLTKGSVYFLPTAKSDLFMKHTLLEIKLIKKLAQHTFPRDKITTHSLTQKGILASYFGNLFIEQLNPSKKKFPDLEKKTIIGILPGSRQEAYLNINYLLDILLCLNKHNKELVFIISKAQTLDLKYIENNLPSSNWSVIKTKNSTQIQHSSSQSLILISEDFPSILYHSQLIIGLAGTANEQAIYLGKKVLCFEGLGPQSTLKRFQEQKKLLGKNLILIKKRSPTNIVNSVLNHLSSTEEPSSPPQKNEARPSKEIIQTILRDIQEKERRP